MFLVIYIFFPIFSKLSMFSKLSPWFQIQDCRIPQFVDPCSCQGWRSAKGQEGDLAPCSPTAECIQIRGHWKPSPLTNIGEVAKSINPDPLLKQGTTRGEWHISYYTHSTLHSKSMVFVSPIIGGQQYLVSHCCDTPGVPARMICVDIWLKGG